MSKLPAARRIGATQNAATAHGAPPSALSGAVNTTMAMPPNPAASRTRDATDTGVPTNPPKSTTHSGIVAGGSRRGWRSPWRLLTYSRPYLPGGPTQGLSPATGRLAKAKSRCIGVTSPAAAMVSGRRSLLTNVTVSRPLPDAQLKNTSSGVLNSPQRWNRIEYRAQLVSQAQVLDATVGPQHPPPGCRLEPGHRFAECGYLITGRLHSTRWSPLPAHHRRAPRQSIVVALPFARTTANASLPHAQSPRPPR